jgi:ribosomal protein L11 methyltransferase
MSATKTSVSIPQNLAADPPDRAGQKLGDKRNPRGDDEQAEVADVAPVGLAIEIPATVGASSASRRVAVRSFEVGERFRVVPPDVPVLDDGRIHLVMAPGAFGSGEHETTASCLEMLATLREVDGAHLLDLGSGTGILAIAALKLGAQHALCVDIDPVAVRTCQANCRLNGVDDRVEHLCGSLDQVAAESFDLILANLYGDILLAVADRLVDRARPGAALLLSGILYQDDFEVRRRYQALGCIVVLNRMLDEFSTRISAL